LDVYHRCTARIDIDDGERYGTAFFVAPGRLLTCSHVIGEDGTPERLRLLYQGNPYDATVVDLIPATLPDCEVYPDIAILGTSFTDHPCVYLDPRFEPRDKFYAFGFTVRKAYGESVTGMCDGIAIEGPNTAEQLIKFSHGQVLGGLSGAPVLNEGTAGVCGMVNRTFNKDLDLGGLAVPARELIANLRAAGLDLDAWHSQHPEWKRTVDPNAGAAAPPQRDDVFAVPRAYNRFFIGRESVFDELRDTLNANGRVGITGLGGVGKTETVIQYAYRERRRYQFVLWASADDVEMLTKSYVALANALRLEQAVLSDEREIVSAVIQWLQANENWLLILDNADTPAVVTPFMPGNDCGHIIVTTRVRDLGMLNVPNLIPLRPLGPDDAAQFLMVRTGQRDRSNRDGAAEVAELLGNLPLALEQAAAHMLSSDVGFQAYADILRGSGMSALQEKRAPEREYRRSVATTWQHAFAAIDDVPVARETASLAAFLAPDDIPLELFVRAGKLVGPSIAKALDSENVGIILNRMLEPLTSYSMISRDVAHNAFAIHRLVQEAIRARMTVAKRRMWASHAIATVAAAQPQVRYGTWDEHNRLLPHVRALSGFIAQLELKSEVAGTMLDTAGTYLFTRARLNEALVLLKRALDVREAVYGVTHQAVAQTLTHLANVNRDLGQFDVARQLYQRSLSIRRKRLPRSAELASTLANMGALFDDLGHFGKAEKYYREALQIRKAIRPIDDLRLAEVQDNLAIVLDAQERYAEAATLHSSALTIRRHHRTDEPLEYAQSLNNSGKHYADRGLYWRAKPFFGDALSIFRDFLEPDHPDVVMCTYNVALVMDYENDDKKAEQLYRRVIELWTEMLGEEHPDLALVYNSLGALHAKLGDVEAARNNYCKGRKIIVAAASRVHPLAKMISENLRALETKKATRRKAQVRSKGLVRLKATGHAPIRVASALHGRRASGGRRKSTKGARVAARGLHGRIAPRRR
jgi:tetratricopeptide (TPR) repeat protein